MKRSTVMMLLGFCLLAGFGQGLAQDAPWADWQFEFYEQNGDAVYSPDLADEEAPRVQTVSTRDSGESGDPYADLQNALALLWLDMNEVEAVDVSKPDRLVVWGDVESEYGERRFAAVLEPSPDGPLVTAFVATEEDFEAMGGPAFIGGDPEAAQSLESALSSGAAALQPGTFGTGEASADETSTDETSADEASEASAEPADDAPAVAEEPATPALTDDGASVPAPVRTTGEDGAPYFPGWQWDDQEGAYIAEPGGAAAPRVQYLNFDVGEVASPAEAAEDAVEKVGLSGATLTDPRQIPSYAQIDGNEGYIVLGTGRAGGEPQSFALLIKKDGEDGHFRTELLYAPPALYASWGGILAPLDTFGVLSSEVRGALDDALLQQVQAAPLDEQSEVFVQVAELSIQYVMQQALATLMMQQQSTLGMMQQMNANIATETSCILTPGCQIEYDGNGDAQMTQP